MVDVKKYLEQSGGNWLRAIHVQVGDKLNILEEGIIDDQTFDKAYINVPVKLVRTGENYSVRLGTKNVARIAETLGEDTKNWIGNQIEVISIETYAGLGQKGMLLKGVLLPKQADLVEEVDILVEEPSILLKKANRDKQVDLIEEAFSKDKQPGLDTITAIRQASTLVKEGITMNEADWNKYITSKARLELLELKLAVQLPDNRFQFSDIAKKYLE